MIVDLLRPGFSLEPLGPTDLGLEHPPLGKYLQRHDILPAESLRDRWSPLRP
jgi:hypothetical protein